MKMIFEVKAIQRIKYKEEVIFHFDNWMKLKTFLELIKDSMDSLESVNISVAYVDEDIKLPFSGDGLEEVDD